MKELMVRCVALAAVLLSQGVAVAGRPRGFLQSLSRHVVLCSTVAPNGDVDPYGLIVAPVSAGKIQKGDVLFDDFANLSNLQGAGVTIMNYRPRTGETSIFASLPRNLPSSPGGVGLTTALTMLRSGWIIVGSTPSRDGTCGTKGRGGLIVLDASGRVAAVWQGKNINGPWSNMAVIDRGSSATLFVAMAGFDVPGPDNPATVNKGTILRLEVEIEPGKPPVLQGQTVVADGLAEQSDRDAFLFGPTGLALDGQGTLYATDTVNNQIIAIANAATRADSAGQGKTIAQNQLLRTPMALIALPGGHLLTTSGGAGQVVEVDPATGKQIYAQWIDVNQAQSPPGSGDLVGLALSADGKGLYYVEDDVNLLMEATP